MKSVIESELKTQGYQPIQSTVLKVIQLYETKNSRHSVMIVGKTGSGKTVTWRILQSTLSRMKKEGDNSFNYVRVSGPPKPFSFNFFHVFKEIKG